MLNASYESGYFLLLLLANNLGCFCCLEAFVLPLCCAFHSGKSFQVFFMYLSIFSFFAVSLSSSSALFVLLEDVSSFK